MNITNAISSIKNLMKKLIFVAIVFVCLVQFIITSGTVQAASTSTIEFNNTSDLTDNFNPDSTPAFSNISNGGLGNSGSVNIPLASDDIWVTRQSYTVTGEGDKYVLSAYFKIKDNSGYVGLGFTNATTSETDLYGSPDKGVGVVFNGGGGAFVNNRALTNLNWSPDLVIGNWYKMVLEITSGGDRSGVYYDLKFQIWNSDENGVLGSLKTEHILSGDPNDDLGSANILHGYFSAVGSRVEKIDHFQINLNGGPTFVAEGLPVVITGDTSSLSINGVQVDGNVKDGQGHTVTARGVCWGISPEPSLSGTCTNNGSGIGTFTATLTDLAPSTIYYARAYATNSLGTSYGEDIVFITLSLEIAPTVITNSANNISRSGANLRGDITSIGTANVTSRGFEYGTTTLYGLNTYMVGDYDVGEYNMSLSNLSCATQYHFRAFAVNNVETSYGEDKTFTTTKCSSSRSSSSGSTVENRVANLIKMGKITEAEELIRRYPSRFPNYIYLLSSGRPINTQGTTTPYVNPYVVRNLSLNMSGNDVKRLQEILIMKDTGVFARSLRTVGATGFFGPYTRSALSEYQEKNRIFPAYGYFGPLTRKQMKDSGVSGIWW